MRVDGLILAAIVGMAAVTYATRAGGLWLIGRVRPSPRLEAGLRAAPGAVLAAIVVPTVLAAGVAGLAAMLAVVLTAVRTRSPLLAAAVGVAVVWAVRARG
ncbi:MAG: hypothetical protein AVDCRST_MAG49-770 [uncultured Thermomicrobiales bacterium]|uniref:Branched-chain amino acid transport n=1 Tax=uncultured Thermomicrobiales bacterium TaxID=1645740 RepID=A0A6J4U448_9BACT|nr:MAG: hypothetical protein AVDCRST_MAG49-770 [uncultured Thermomicrobiales bacterium]